MWVDWAFAILVKDMHARECSDGESPSLISGQPSDKFTNTWSLSAMLSEKGSMLALEAFALNRGSVCRGPVA